MWEKPRRRRSDDDNGRRGLPLFPLVLVVILAGLLMGGVLARFFGASTPPQAPPRAVVALPTPIATPAPIPTTPPAARSPAPSVTPTATPTATPAPAPSVLPTAMRTLAHRQRFVIAAATPKRALQARPTPLAVATKPPAAKPVIVAAAPKASAPLVVGDDRATVLVRSYLEALARGDRSTATSYLARGAPNENFMSSDSKIESIRSSSIGPEEYHVTADIQTNSGEYYVTFTVERNPGGLAITDHYSIKPQ